MKCVLVGIAKNEGPYIWEWVAHHRSIGFTDIIIFQNDSDDFTHETLKTLRRMGAIQYFYNNAHPGKHQVKAYKRAAKLPEFMDADWAMALDLDEFLVIKPGQGHLDDLFAASPRFDSMLVNWKFFGNCGHMVLNGDLVTARFTQAEPPGRVANRFTGYKALFSVQTFGRPGIHQPRDPKIDEDTIVRVNGSGLHTSEFALKNWMCKDPSERSIAQINHYALKDTSSFVLKSDRGSAHQSNRAIGEKYWTSHNYNHVADTVLADRAAQLEVEMDDMDQVVYGRLTTMRNRAIRTHIARAETLLENPDYRALYDSCQTL